MIDDIVNAIIQRWVSFVFSLTLLWLVTNHFHHGLNKFPGPLIASLTDWWRFWDVWGRRPDLTQRRLHEKYGDFVRLGPNCISIADPRALKTIYGLNKGFVKSGFYPVQQAISRGERLPSLFSTTDEAFHAQLRRCVNSAFSMSAMVQYEPSVNIMTKKFLDQTAVLYAKPGKVCDFANWLQFLAFDVIGHITYSKSHGFVERNEDVDGMVNYLGHLFSYVAPVSFLDMLKPYRSMLTDEKVGQMPFLDLIFLKNPILRLLDKCGIYRSTFPVVIFAQARMTERLAELDIAKSSGEDPSPTAKRGDLLSQFLKAKMENPTFFHDGRVLTMAVSMAFAGSETTAISLSAIFYYLCRNPFSLRKVRAELDAAVSDGRLRPVTDGDSLVSWAESQRLPYLDACVKEAFRLHPAAGLPLERVVPAGGIEIAGQFIPGGTVVGCSAWILHRRAEIFGEDVNEFRPERWMQANSARRREMESTLFHFGMGSRTCIGKNISLLEIYKLVPSFLRRFEVSFANPDRDWRLHNSWFVKQYDFLCRFKERTLAEDQNMHI